jgi:hypothetical protein
MKKKPHSTTTSGPKDDLTAGELFSFEVVECEQGGFGIKMDGRDMLLPYGKPFWSPKDSRAHYHKKMTEFYIVRRRYAKPLWQAE